MVGTYESTGGAPQAHFALFHSYWPALTPYYGGTSRAQLISSSRAPRLGSSQRAVHPTSPKERKLLQKPKAKKRVAGGISILPSISRLPPRFLHCIPPPFRSIILPAINHARLFEYKDQRPSLPLRYREELGRGRFVLLGISSQALLPIATPSHLQNIFVLQLLKPHM